MNTMEDLHNYLLTTTYDITIILLTSISDTSNDF